MMKDPQLFYFVLNVSVVLVMAVVGWLLRRAIAGNDAKVEKVIEKIDGAATELSKLQILIAGEYFRREEQSEFSKHVEGVLAQLRGNIHDLRDGSQATATKVAMLEGALLKERKPS